MDYSLCKASVCKAYQDVINDVISNAREHFIDDGVDDAILQELKQLWETKLAATKAVDPKSDETDRLLGKSNKPSNNRYNSPKRPHPYFQQQPQVQQHLLPQQLQTQQQQTEHPLPHAFPQLLPLEMIHQQMPVQHIPLQHLINKQVVGQVPPNNHMPQGPIRHEFPEWRRLPIEITIPVALGNGKRTLSIDVPEVFLHSHFLKSILTGEVIGTTMELSDASACAFLQDQVNAAFLEYRRSFFNNFSNFNAHPSMVHDGSRNDQVQNRLKSIPQRDGPADASDEDEDISDDVSDNDIGDDGKDDMEEYFDEESDGESLNSGDDVSDVEDIEEQFDTANVIVCQFDKVSRKRNQWRIQLKDGIMNLEGVDFVFDRANGDAPW